MRKFVIVLLLLAGCVTANAQVESVKIKTSAICGMCKEAIERDLTFEMGIKKVDLDLETKEVTVAYVAKKTDAEKIRKRITMIGYNADSLQRDPKVYAALPDCCKDGAHQDDH